MSKDLAYTPLRHYEYGVKKCSALHQEVTFNNAMSVGYCTLLFGNLGQGKANVVVAARRIDVEARTDLLYVNSLEYPPAHGKMSRILASWFFCNLSLSTALQLIASRVYCI